MPVPAPKTYDELLDRAGVRIGGPKRKLAGGSENDIEKAITRYLSYALPENSVSFHTMGGGYKLSVYELGKLKAAGYIAGIPDRCIIWRGNAYFLECKSARGVLTESQRAMFPRIEAAGCPIAIVRSVDDVQRALIEWEIPLRCQLLI